MRFRKDEGFTLVELMVVVLIIGILIAVAVPVFNSARANAQKRTCEATQRTAEGAYQTWYADSPANATSALTFANIGDLNGALVPNFIKQNVSCPVGGTASITATFAASGLSVNVLCSNASPVHANP